MLLIKIAYPRWGSPWLNSTNTVSAVIKINLFMSPAVPRLLRVVWVHSNFGRKIKLSILGKLETTSVCIGLSPPRFTLYNKKDLQLILENNIWIRQWLNLVRKHAQVLLSSLASCPTSKEFQRALCPSLCIPESFLCLYLPAPVRK